MASNTFQRKTVDDKITTYSRKGTQGAPVKPAHLKRTYVIPVRLDEQDYNRFCEARNDFMSASAFASLMIFTGIEKYNDMQLFESNNC